MKLVLAAYLVLLHAVIVVMVLRPDLATRVLTKVGMYRMAPEKMRVLGWQRQAEPRQPRGAVVLLGDSLTRGLVGANIAPVTINYGISGLQSHELADVVGQYHSLRTARAVSLSIGVNDALAGRADRLASAIPVILSHVPPETPVVITSVFPGPAIPAEGVAEANAVLRAACAERCTLIDASELVGPLGADAFEADGVHLSLAAYERWEAAIREAVAHENTPRAMVLE